MIRHIVIACVTMLFSISNHAATVYKTVGPDGRIIYSDKPPSQASAPTKAISLRQMPATPLPDSLLRFREEIQQGIKQRESLANLGRVTLFTAPWCGYCRQARAYLQQKNIAFDEYDIETESGKTRFVQAGGAGGGIPYLVLKGQGHRGFSSSGYDELFGR